MGSHAPNFGASHSPDKPFYGPKPVQASHFLSPTKPDVQVPKEEKPLIETPKAVGLVADKQATPNSIVRRKYEMCKNWREKGSCRYGDKCLFAHGEHELSRRQSAESSTENKQESPQKKDQAEINSVKLAHPEVTAISLDENSKAEADKENKNEEQLVSEDSARKVIMPEEAKVLESMENMEAIEVSGRKQCFGEELTRPNSSAAELQTNTSS